MASFRVDIAFVGKDVEFDWKKLDEDKKPDDFDAIGVINVYSQRGVTLRVFYKGSGKRIYKFEGKESEEKDETKWKPKADLKGLLNHPHWNGYFELDIHKGDPPIAVG